MGLTGPAMLPGPSDNCPRCVTVTAAPYQAETGPGGMRAFYSCPRCGYRWHTGWLLSPAEMAQYETGDAA